MKLKGVVGNWKLCLVLLLSLILTSITACADGGEEKKVIRMADTPWSCTPPLNLRAKIILEEMGYEVELVSLSMDMAWVGVAAGEIDVIMDAWVLNYPEKLIGFGDTIAIVGLNYGGAVQGTFVPTSTTPPELTSLGQLNDYIELFDKDGDGRGEMHGLEPGTGSNRIQLLQIEQLELNYDLVESGEFAVLTELERRIAKGETMAFQLWRPHWVFGKYDLRLLEDPSGNTPESIIMTVVNEDLLETAPDVCLLLNRFTTTVDEVSDMIYECEVEERESMEIAQEWIENNRDKVNDWLEVE